MKTLPILALLITLIFSCESPKEESKTAEQSTLGYDSLLAAETGADAYGMRKYVLAYLKAGPVRSQTKAEADSLQRLHMENIGRMAEAGKLVLAGPFMDDGEVRGIYVFAVDTMEEAEELTNSDPSVQAGRLIMELHPWYGSAALMKVNELHTKLSKEPN